MNTQLPTEEQLPAMDVETKRKWIEALRSRKYRRAQGRLRKDGKFCCLGVLCETMGWEYDGHDGEPESHHLMSAGLTEIAMSVCVRLNDGTLQESPYLKAYTGKVPGYRNQKGASFKHIADFIEKKL